MGRGLNSYVLKKYETEIRSLKYCFYCQNDINDVHIEHIFPLSLGGDSHISNLTGACSVCNLYKSNFSIEEFLERMFIKRDDIRKKFYRVSSKHRKNIKRHNFIDTDLVKKIILFRKQHSYFSSVINSILNNKYHIQWGKIPSTLHTTTMSELMKKLNY